MRRFLRAAAIRVLSRPSTINYNEPCIIKNAISHWPAVRLRRWHPRRLQVTYGDRLFEFGRGVHSNQTLLTTLERFCNLKHPHTRRQCYIFDSTFDADCPELLDDYNIPAWFQFDGSHPVSNVQCSYRWLLMGHAGSGSHLHTDPPLTSAWNALAYGLKEWVVIQPVTTEDQQQPELHQALSAFNKRMLERAAAAPLNRWFLKHVPRLWCHAQCVASADSGRCSASGERATQTTVQHTPRMMRFLQRPGDIVYIPTGWLHAVLNRSLSVAVTHNFIFPECARTSSQAQAARGR